MGNGGPHPRPFAGQTLYCISGMWSDEWWDNPSAWANWACTFHGWSWAEWQQFAHLWAETAGMAPPLAGRVRARLMDAYRTFFFNWRRVPGQSARGDVRTAARQVYTDLQRLRNVVLVGHSKGGAVIKHLLAAPWVWTPGTRPRGAIFIDAPLDLLREVVGWLFGWGVRPLLQWRPPADVPGITINNWLDLTGGRLPGVRNVQVLIWNDFLHPFPPHGLKHRQAPLALDMLRQAQASTD